MRLNFSNLKVNNSTNNSINSTNSVTNDLANFSSSNSIEDQFILRLPASLASILNTELSENDYSLPGDLSIRFLSPRTAIVRHSRFIKEAYPAILVDSPTVMETLKSSNLSIVEIEPITSEEVTNNNNNNNNNSSNINTHSSLNPSNSDPDLIAGQYYKVADVNQILLVLDLDTPEGMRVFNNRIPPGLQDELLKHLSNPTCSDLGTLTKTSSSTSNPTSITPFESSPIWAQWPDGLTPPMRQAKLKRFAPRPWHASSLSELERIEKEVERLIKADGQAIESKFSLISDEGNVLLGEDFDNITKDNHDEEEDITKDDIETDKSIPKNDDNTNFDQEEDEDHFEESEESGESEDSEASDIEDMNDFAAEIEGNLLQEEGSQSGNVTTDNNSISNTSSTNMNQSPQLSEHDRLIKDLEAKLAEKLKQAESVSNPLIKARIEDVIKQLEDNLRNLKQ